MQQALAEGLLCAGLVAGVGRCDEMAGFAAAHEGCPQRGPLRQLCGAVSPPPVKSDDLCRKRAPTGVS